MQQFPNAIFLTDDAAARLAAITIKYRVHGTIGILLRARRRQQLSKEAVIKLLKGIPTQSTLYIRQALLNEVISQLENNVPDE